MTVMDTSRTMTTRQTHRDTRIIIMVALVVPGVAILMEWHMTKNQLAIPVGNYISMTNLAIVARPCMTGLRLLPFCFFSCVVAVVVV